MTAKETKELTLEIWVYLYEHPEIEYKDDLPKELWDKIKDLNYECLLCEYWEDLRGFKKMCKDCPLNVKGKEYLCSFYRAWYYAKTDQERKKAAKVIVDKVKAWKV